jgi:glutamate formiminotransferase/formiminotetrahydrofolate cyclodeaminase
MAEAAFRGAKAALQRIDLRTHKGEHKRMGAMDVCPFVPLAGASMADAVATAKRVGERIGRELGLPVFLYAEAASREERRVLGNVRNKEFEGLMSLVGTDPAFAPDYGPAKMHATAGGVSVGARNFLIAYNVNLNTRDKKLANTIAQALREAGKSKKGADGTTTNVPGRFKECRAVGWVIEGCGALTGGEPPADWRWCPSRGNRAT